MAEVNPAAWTQGGCHTAQVDRQVIAGLVCAQGVDEPGDLAVSAPGGMQTQVAEGGAFVEGTTTSGQGMYHVYNDAPVNLTHSPADATDPRIDLVIARVYDSQYAGTTDEWLLEIVEGSPSPSPVPPTVPDSSLVLVEVTVRAGATEILTSDIGDQADVYESCGSASAATSILKAGRISTASIPSGNQWTEIGSVTFVEPFPTGVTPRVSIDDQTNFSGLDPVMLAANAISESGFTLVGKCNSSKGSQGVDWIAVADTEM